MMIIDNFYTFKVINCLSMELPNEIVLRPRFKRHIPNELGHALTEFKATAALDPRYKTSIVDAHIFIRIPKKHQHFWSPQLHLELREDDVEGTCIHGLFGPSPTVWTFFMFLHFVAAGLFIASGIWCYTRTVLNEAILFPVITMVSLVVIWMVLYLAGRTGKKKGEPQMYELYFYMRECFGIERFSR